MNYTIAVTVADGRAVVSALEHAPEGSYVIAGHDDDGQRSISITRRTAEGRTVQVANSTHSRE